MICYCSDCKIYYRDNIIEILKKKGCPICKNSDYAFNFKDVQNDKYDIPIKTIKKATEK